MKRHWVLDRPVCVDHLPRTVMHRYRMQALDDRYNSFDGCYNKFVQAHDC